MNVIRVMGRLAIVLTFIALLGGLLMPAYSAYASVLPDDDSDVEIEGTIMKISPKGTSIVIDGTQIYINDYTRISLIIQPLRFLPDCGAYRRCGHV